jgi:hypothetical protein
MNRCTRLRAASVALAITLPASTAFAGPLGLNLGARTGYAIASGEAARDDAMTDVIAGAVPVHLDLTYSFAPILNAGVYASYGIGVKGDKTSSSRDGVTTTLDSVSTTAFGIQANVDLSLAWAGVFAGWETFRGSSTASLGTTSITAKAAWSGWQAGVQGGADWPLLPGFTVGPFASFAVAQYGTVDSEVSAPVSMSESSDIEEKALHQWLTLGVRGSFGL